MAVLSMIHPDMFRPHYAALILMAIVTALLFIAVLKSCDALVDYLDPPAVESWVTPQSDFDQVAVLLGNDAAASESAKESFELRAAHGDIFAQRAILDYWTISDSDVRNTNLVTWSLIVLACISGAEVEKTRGHTRNAHLTRMNLLIQDAGTEEKRRGIELARKWFRRNADSGELDYCKTEEIDLVERDKELGMIIGTD